MLRGEHPFWIAPDALKGKEDYKALYERMMRHRPTATKARDILHEGEGLIKLDPAIALEHLIQWSLHPIPKERPSLNKMVDALKAIRQNYLSMSTHL